MPDISPAYDASYSSPSRLRVIIYNDKLTYHGTIRLQQEIVGFHAFSIFLIFNIHLLLIFAYFKMLPYCTVNSIYMLGYSYKVLKIN